jgi:hypothetical protein
MFYNNVDAKETDMPDRRGRKGRSEDLLPKDRMRWAREIWADRDEIAI